MLCYWTRLDWHETSVPSCMAAKHYQFSYDRIAQMFSNSVIRWTSYQGRSISYRRPELSRTSASRPPIVEWLYAVVAGNRRYCSNRYVYSRFLKVVVSVSQSLCRSLYSEKKCRLHRAFWNRHINVPVSGGSFMNESFLWNEHSEGTIPPTRYFWVQYVQNQIVP